MSSTLYVDIGTGYCGLTYKRVIDYMQGRFNNQSEKFADIVREIIVEVLQDVASRHEWTWLNQVGTLAIEQGVSEYTLSPSCMFIDGPIALHNNGQVLRADMSVVQKIRGENRDNSRALPRRYAMTGRQTLLLAPTPSQDYTGTYQFQTFIPLCAEDITDDSPLPLPVNDHHVVLAGVETKIRMDDDRWDRATISSEAKYERAIANQFWRDQKGRQDQMVLDDHDNVWPLNSVYWWG